VEIIVHGCGKFFEKTVVAYDEENPYFAGRHPIATISESHQGVNKEGKPKKIS
jgi:hypothetical protein